MIRVLSIIGTRPEAIKVIPVIRELTSHPGVFSSKLCITAQHRQMLDQVLSLFGVTPDHDLNIMRPAQSLTDITTAVMQGLVPILEAERPDWVLVQGDTTTTIAASLAAFYAHIPIGHIEAGLRTFDKYRPFPEEINRRLTSVLADVHFAPTAWAAGNLYREGVPEERVVITGNTVIDALQHVASMSFDPTGTPLAGLPIGRKRIILVTTHRRENFGAGLEAVYAGLRTLADRYDDIHFAFPVHLNPNVREPVQRFLGDARNVTLLPPLDYLPMVWLMKHCHLVITDSGGLQEEAPGLGKPVLVLRETTERPEGVEAGTVKLVGTDRDILVEWGTRLLDDQDLYQRMSQATNPYGSGDAATHIARVLSHGRIAEVAPAVQSERSGALAVLAQIAKRLDGLPPMGGQGNVAPNLSTG